MSPSPRDTRLKPVAFTAIAVVGLPVLTLCLVEGASSAILFAREVSRGLQIAPDASRQRVRYDSLLGWVGRPNVYVPDVWGPGIYYRTNARGFRNNDETSLRSPEGRVRIICSGDSFTEGVGVDNDHTWCSLLAAMNPRFEGINLGLLGYGFDQAYLRFKRDGRPLEHATHIFAFIGNDLRRMELLRIWYWGKPRLVLQDGVLTLENVPVPRLVPRFPKLRFVLGPAEELRIFQFFGKLKAKLGGAPADRAGRDSALGEVASAIVGNLGAMSRVDGTSLVLVHLPTLKDYLRPSRNRWSQQLRAAAEREAGVVYLDLTTELRRLPPDSAAAMFIPPPSAPRPPDGNGQGHYTARGNQWVADHLFRHVARLTENKLGVSRDLRDPK